MALSVNMQQGHVFRVDDGIRSPITAHVWLG
jgi:hypothetical protein